MDIIKRITLFFLIGSLIFSCKSSEKAAAPENFYFKTVWIDGQTGQNIYYNSRSKAILRISFSAPISRTSASTSVTLTNNNEAIPLAFSFENSDSILVATPQNDMKNLTKYSYKVSPTLQSQKQTLLTASISVDLITPIDSSDKFPRISDDALLDLVQKQTLKYFWDFGHPISGMARERNTSGDVVTTGGTGFGIMAIVVGVNRNFISRTDAVARLLKMTNFLKNTTKSYHGAFPHWLNGATGATVPFSQKDDGADLVETSYLMQGLLTARQYFKGTNSDETTLRQTINDLLNAVEWTWFTKNGTETNLYWHWSPTYNWDMNMPIRGWNEALITYVMAAASTKFAISKTIYDNSWAQNGKMVNGNSYYTYKLPLGPDKGGPLFFEHYSFLGINPHNLSDVYADYWQQVQNHTLINYSYCKENPKNYNGYSENCWGLTASDEQNGYSAHEPNNDNGVISPTAAISSLPYTPQQSMAALRFFYYKLGDKIWKDDGFVDAFNLSNLWFADSFLAIDQGPEIVMIENYRSNLLWNLFMSASETQQGLNNLGFKK